MFECANLNTGRASSSNPKEIFSIEYCDSTQGALLLCSGDGGFLDVYRLSDFGSDKMTGIRRLARNYWALSTSC